MLITLFNIYFYFLFVFLREKTKFWILAVLFLDKILYYDINSFGFLFFLKNLRLLSWFNFISSITRRLWKLFYLFLIEYFFFFIIFRSLAGSIVIIWTGNHFQLDKIENKFLCLKSVTDFFSIFILICS